MTERTSRGRKFLIDALILSAVNILMRGIGVSFNAFVNQRIGSESMGLLTLVMSVYSFAVTVALSCVNIAAVKLTSERVALLDQNDSYSYRQSLKKIVRSVSAYSLLFGVSSGVILYLSSDFISNSLLHDIRTLTSLRILSFTLPAISLSSAFNGYFTGLKKVRKNAVVSISEQFMKIILTSTALVWIVKGNVEQSCIAVVGGSALAEAFSLLLNLCLYFFDVKSIKKRTGKTKNIINTSFKDTATIALPSAIGAYARQGLTTLEHLAIPNGIEKSGLTKSAALSSYGLLQGIAFPLVMFPYALIGSFTTLLVPEISEANALKEYGQIQRITKRVYRYSAYFSLLACGIFVNFSKELGLMIYSSSEAATYTLLLGFLVPFMYLDTVVDSILKGLGEQFYIMIVNIADAGAGLLLVLFLTPQFGIYGYIISMWICEIGNLGASIMRLSKITKVSVKEAIREYQKPAIIIGILSLIRYFFFKNISPILSILIFGALYILLILFTKKETEAKPSISL